MRKYWFLWVLTVISSCSVISENKNPNFEPMLVEYLKFGISEKVAIQQLHDNFTGVQVENYECSSPLSFVQCTGNRMLLASFNYGLPSVVCNRPTALVFIQLNSDNLVLSYIVDRVRTCL